MKTVGRLDIKSFLKEFFTARFMKVYIFLYCDQIPDKMQLKKRGFIFTDMSTVIQSIMAGNAW